MMELQYFRSCLDANDDCATSKNGPNNLRNKCIVVKVDDDAVVDGGQTIRRFDYDDVVAYVNCRRTSADIVLMNILLRRVGECSQECLR